MSKQSILRIPQMVQAVQSQGATLQPEQTRKQPKRPNALLQAQQVGRGLRQGKGVLEGQDGIASKVNRPWISKNPALLDIHGPTLERSNHLPTSWLKKRACEGTGTRPSPPPLKSCEHTRPPPLHGLRSPKIRCLFRRQVLARPRHRVAPTPAGPPPSHVGI